MVGDLIGMAILQSTSPDFYYGVYRVAPCRAVIEIHFDGDVHRTHLVGQFLVRIRFLLLKLVEYSSEIPDWGVLHLSR